MTREKKSEATQKVQPAMTGYQMAQAVVATLCLEDLVTLKLDMDNLIGQKQKEQQKELYAKMLSMVKATGFASVEEFVGVQKEQTIKNDQGVKMPQKYQSMDGTKAWSGKGRRPSWASAHLAEGGQLEDLAIL